MFILSLVPIHLSRDSDSVMVNQFNSVDVVEHRIMELEAALTGMILWQYVEYVPGVNYYDANSVRQELYSLRTQELQIVQQTGVISNNDSQARLNQVQTSQLMADVRINDLAMLYENIVSQTTPPYHVSGVDNANWYYVIQEQNRANQYKQELTSAQQFWNQIVQLELGPTEPEETEEEEDDKDTEPFVFPEDEKLLRLALSKRAVANLQALIGAVSQKSDVEEVISKIDSIKSELKQQLKLAGYTRIDNKNDSDTAAKATSHLHSELRSLLNEKNVREIMASFEDSLASQLSEAIEGLVSVVEI